jgi:hypothetical protein
MLQSRPDATGSRSQVEFSRDFPLAEISDAD